MYKFLGSLFLVLLALKLTDIITWSWWAVCSPLIAMPILFIVTIATLILIVGKK